MLHEAVSATVEQVLGLPFVTLLSEQSAFEKGRERKRERRRKSDRGDSLERIWSICVSVSNATWKREASHSQMNHTAENVSILIQRHSGKSTTGKA